MLQAGARTHGQDAFEPGAVYLRACRVEEGLHAADKGEEHTNRMIFSWELYICGLEG